MAPESSLQETRLFPTAYLQIFLHRGTKGKGGNMKSKSHSPSRATEN